MKLLDLEPEFLKITSPDGRTFEHRDDISPQQADGILFICPKCKGTSNHRVLCLQPHVPQTIGPTPGRWAFEGTGFHDLTLKAGSSSVFLQGGCQAHFWIRRGEIVNA